MSLATMSSESTARTAMPAAPHSMSVVMRPPWSPPWGLDTVGRTSISIPAP